MPFVPPLVLVAAVEVVDVDVLDVVPEVPPVEVDVDVDVEDSVGFRDVVEVVEATDVAEFVVPEPEPELELVRPPLEPWDVPPRSAVATHPAKDIIASPTTVDLRFMREPPRSEWSVVVESITDSYSIRRRPTHFTAANSPNPSPAI